MCPWCGDVYKELSIWEIHKCKVDGDEEDMLDSETE